jgi:hypothetical protein
LSGLILKSLLRTSICSRHFSLASSSCITWRIRTFILE